MLTARMDDLINAILDGEASGEDVAELQSLVGDDTQIAACLADRVAEHRLLGVIHQPFDSRIFIDAVMASIDAEEQSITDDIVDKIQGTEPTNISATNRKVWHPTAHNSAGATATKYFVGLAVAVSLLLIALVAAWSYLGRSNDDGTERSIAHTSQTTRKQSANPIATLLLAEDCVWAAEVKIDEGQRLGLGRVELDGGTAVIRFDGGAELVMAGPALIDLRSAASVLVHFGDVVVRAEDGEEGFVVTTLTAEVIDLGTEFAVKVAHDGATEVHVLEGEVSYRTLDSDLANILRTGEGVAIDKNGKPTAVPMNSPRFKDYLRQMNPRARTDLLSAYEGFNYSPGVLPLEESTVGIGWAGPWRRRSPTERTLPTDDESPDQLDIVHGQLNVAWPVPGGRLGMLRLPAHNTYYVRPLEKPLQLDRDGVTYFSMMVRETERPTGRRRHRERVRLTFRSLNDYYGQYISFGHGSGYQPRVRTGDGAMHVSPMVLPPEQTTFWIAKIVTRAEGDDEIYFRVYGENDVLGYAEPATWHVVTRGVDLDSQLDCVLLSSEGTTARIVDELRVGPIWRSVAPMMKGTE